MKKLILLALCFAYFQTQAQMRVKTEDGKIIELSSDGTWKVVGGSSTPTANNPPATPSPNAESPNSNTSTSECDYYECGDLKIENNGDYQVIVYIKKALKLTNNLNYGATNRHNSQTNTRDKKVYEYVDELKVMINGGNTQKIYFLKEGSYDYEIYASNYGTISTGQVYIPKCGSESFTLNK